MAAVLSVADVGREDSEAEAVGEESRRRRVFLKKGEIYAHLEPAMKSATAME